MVRNGSNKSCKMPPPFSYADILQAVCRFIQVQNQMQGDSIIIEDHHRKAAAEIIPHLLELLKRDDRRMALSVAGESGSGKSETAAAIAEQLEQGGIGAAIFQQDDYFVYPPKSNDRARREDISWVGSQEVRLEQMDRNLAQFLAGEKVIEKPLVIYEQDRVITEQIEPGDARVAIAEGTYTSLLEQVSIRIFIDRNYTDTRAHREKRNRDESELDAFIDRVLEIEHGIISAHKARADFLIHKDYSASRVE